MLVLSKEDLLAKIDEKKLELHRIASQNGISSGETIQCSQELDVLILDYQKRFSSKQQKSLFTTITGCFQLGILAFLHPLF